MPRPTGGTVGRRESYQQQTARDALAEISGGIFSSPVPDYASTLMTQAELDVEEENLRFLRGEPSSGESLTNTGDAQRFWTASSSDPRSSAAAVRRPVNASNQSPIVTDERAQDVSNRDYNYWAPDADDGEDDQPRISRHPSNYEPGYMNDSDGPGDLLRHTMRLRRLRDHFQSQLNRSTAQSGDSTPSTQRHPSRFIENGMNPTSSELRTQAMIQAVRQNAEGSSRLRGGSDRITWDGELHAQGNEDVELPASDAGASNISQSQRRQLQQAAIQRQIAQNRNLHDEFQRHRSNLEEQLRRRQQSMSGYSSADTRHRRAASTPYTPTTSMSMENTVRYLESLRLCESKAEGLGAADDSGFDPEELSPHNIDDFLLETTYIPAPPATSFLQRGCVFSGTQHAMPARWLTWTDPIFGSNRSRVRLPNYDNPAPRTTSPIQSPFTQLARNDPSQPRDLVREPDGPVDDHWPVKVTLHAVDLDEMTLSGTMEASDVPDKSSPAKTSNITTYLEGEIIDFRKFTLETKSFKADSRVDGVYWKKLPPFRDMKDDEEVTKCLLSRDWLQRELMTNWVLMRWKEKHFVTPTEAESSLTISGFYYISLRRSDGHVEGLYYDPSSTPYQHLSLRSETRTFPAYEFR